MLFFLTGYLLMSAGLFFIFPKAGEAGWKGLAPGLNFVVWCKIIGRKPWHAAWLLFPIVNIFILAGMAIDLVRSFGYHLFWHSVVAVVLLPLAFLYLGLKPEEKYEGPILDKEREFKAKLKDARDGNNTRLVKKLEAQNPYRKSSVREWAEAIIFAVFAAAFIRMFLIEAYVIPTSSMEGSMLVGDFLFVSKAHYGIRMPQTIAMVPLLHNRIPGLNAESYLENPKLDYYRLPALESIDHNDPVVFNYPEGDSVYIFPERTWGIYDYRRGSLPPMHAQQIKSGRKKLVTRPMDKKDHYIKRCIGLPGDSLMIRDRQVYINGRPAKKPEYIQFMYMVNYPSGTINTAKFDEWGISREDRIDQSNNSLVLILSEDQKAKIQSMDPNIEIEPVEVGALQRNPNKTFPHDPEHFPNWTVDNFGPIYIPEEGATVQLTESNIALYRRIIQTYEGNDFAQRNGKFYINGEATDRYTFRQNYYWMMGDNRHNSEDSRIWGYVPEDHIVGKPLFIWFATKEGSLANGINWRRIGKTNFE